MHDLIIIGAGPAGLTAGIYAGRYRLDTLVLEKMSVGGQIILSETIENFPGFPEGLTTQELMDRFKKQLDNIGVPVENKEAIEILPAGDGSYTVGAANKSYDTRTIIIASGAASKRLEVAGEERLIGRGVSYCATCDGPLFRNKEVVVVGGGDRALEEALFLARYAQKVTLIHRRQELRASRILEERARKENKIALVLDSVITEILGEKMVEAVKIKNVKSGSEHTLSCQGVFVFVGIKPNTAFLKNLLHTDEAGFIMTDQEFKTSREGIFACGDCCRKSLYQVVTACGEGASAADAAHKYLLKKP